MATRPGWTPGRPIDPMRKLLVQGIACVVLGLLFSGGGRADTEIGHAFEIISRVPKYLVGIHDLIIEGDATQVVLVEVYSTAPELPSTLYLIPSGGTLSTMKLPPIVLCGEGFDVDNESDALMISVHGCHPDSGPYRLDAGGITRIER